MISVLVQGGLIAYALDNNFNVTQLTAVVIGIVFIILGNYLPKKEFWGKYNFNLFGFRKKVSMSKKVIRAYALLMTFSGVAIFISGFFSSTVALVFNSYFCNCFYGFTFFTWLKNIKLSNLL